MSTALIVTAASVVWWGALIAVSRVVLLRYGFDPWALSFIQLCAGGIVLLALGGGRSLALASLRRPATWALGVLRVASAALYTAVLAWVSALEAGTIGAVSLPLVTLAVWAAFGRRPRLRELPGHLVILAAIAAVVGGLDPSIRQAVVYLMLLNAVCIALIAIVAERHPDNLSDEPGARLRFTGAVLLTTATLFLAARAVGMGGGAAAAAWDWPLLAAGVAVGVVLRAPSMVLTFWSIRLVGAQNYTAANAFLPLVGMTLEEAAVGVGLTDVSRFQANVLVLSVVVVVGTLWILRVRFAGRVAGGASTRKFTCN